jgi:SAM-dependent methyltransferase
MISPLSASLPLVAYVEAFCRQARVLWVGDARSALPKALIDRGARLVYACDRDPLRRREAQARSQDRAITFGSLDDGPAALREGYFELALVENLAAESNPVEVLATIARLLSPRGVALVAAPNPDAKRPLLASAPSQRPLDYYALYDAVISQLPEVRMLGQVPFVGYAVVDFSAEGDPNPVLDTSLAPPRGEEPDYFVALASRERRALEEYAVIQLCAADVLKANASKAEVVPSPVPVVAAAPLTPAPAPAVKPAVAPSQAALEQRLAKQELWIGELEARAGTADERADAAESELDELRERLGNLEQIHNQQRAELTQQRDALKGEGEQLRRRLNELDERSAAKEAELQALKRELAQRLAAKEAESLAEKQELERRLAAQQAELSALQTGSEGASDLERLEAQLRQRGERVLELERDLAEAERVGRELVRKLREPAAASNAQSLAERLALAEAELITLRWSLELAKGGGAGNGAKRLS